MQQSEEASQEQERSQSGNESMQGEQEEAASQQEAASPSADGSAGSGSQEEQEPEASQDVSGDAPGSPSVSGQSRSDVPDASVSELTDGQEAAGYRGSRKRASREESPSTAQRSSKVARATRSSAELDDPIDAATAAALAADEFTDMEVHPQLMPEAKLKLKSDPFKIRRDSDLDLDPEPDLDPALKEAQEAVLEEIKAQEQREARQQPAGRQSTPQASANVISDVVDFLRLAAAQDPTLMSKIDFATLCTSGYKYNTMWSRMERIVRCAAGRAPPASVVYMLPGHVIAWCSPHASPSHVITPCTRRCDRGRPVQHCAALCYPAQAPSQVPAALPADATLCAAC
jgi:hypothetical protein